MDKVVDINKGKENEELEEVMTEEGEPKTIEALEEKVVYQLIDLRDTMEINVQSMNTVKGWDNVMRAMITYGVKGIPDQDLVHELHKDSLEALGNGVAIVDSLIKDTAYIYQDSDEDIFDNILDFRYTDRGSRIFEENLRQVLRWQMVSPYAERLQALRSLAQKTLKEIEENAAK